jgi:peptide/nickel transport system ATP-binding protein
MRRGMPSEEQPVLSIEKLTVAYRSGRQWRDAVREVSFAIHTGHTYGLVGESGSGKTTLILAVMRYLAENGAIRGGKILLAGRDICTLKKSEMRRVWGSQLTMVPQDPLSSLNPSIKIGEQLAETLRHRLSLGNTAAKDRVIELLEMVHLADPRHVAGSYPHQISGGMQQRVMIAMALSTEPLLLVLDEPTTSLDVTTQAVILDLLRELIQGRKTAVLYVTHNLGVVASICDRVAVLYAGELVEDSPASELFHHPWHPYTRGLLGSVPRLGETKKETALRAIEGSIPTLGMGAGGCVFSPRCPYAIEICEKRPPLYPGEGHRLSRCHRWREMEFLNGIVAASTRSFPSPREQGAPPTLELKDVRVYFPLRRSFRDVFAGQPGRCVKAVDRISLSVRRNQTLGLVGESGSGKTTLSRAVVGLEKPTGGDITLLDLPLPPGLGRRRSRVLPHLQMVFQNPEEALNPYHTVGEALRRPLISLLRKQRSWAAEEVGRLLKLVRLPPDYAYRYPRQLSGGEKQRVSIARAFASHPDLLICDEPVSSLDVSVQASILNLLNTLQEQFGNSLLFISHDLAVVGYIADRIAVIYLGRLMEVARSADLFEPPYHPYTEALLSAVPLMDPDAKQEHIRLEGEIPSPLEEISGCPFHTRCHRFLGEQCVTETPLWQKEEDKHIFCHIPMQQLRRIQTRAFDFFSEPEGE